MRTLRGGAKRRPDGTLSQAAPATPAPHSGPETFRVVRVEVRPTAPLDEAVREFKRRVIELVLGEAGGNRSEAARRLGIQRTYLHRLIRNLEIDCPPALRRSEMSSSG
ncbi:MAG: helix-turn-helix domain-containing protein [Anaerolineae bacterium]